MSITLGNTPIAGLSERTKYNAHHLLDFKWSDCLMNDVSWLRADTFSWQDGSVYVAAYNHLAADLQGTTAETETIGSYTITFYRASDGHKIVLADQETTVANIYSETGTTWYYIVDTTNTRFKFPRTTYNAYSKTLAVKGNGIALGLARGDSFQYTAGLTTTSGDNASLNWNAGAYGTTVDQQVAFGSGPSVGSVGITNDATKSGIIAQSATLDNMYLYFYVGDFSQTATEQTAGLNSEQLNNKVDRSDLAEVQCVIETYSNGTSWYRVYSDGWCEQGGEVYVSNTTVNVNFLKSFTNTNYYCNCRAITSGSYNSTSSIENLTTSTMGIRSTASATWRWQACGYII